MDDLISFAAGVFKDTVVEWATEHPREVIALGALFVAGYYMGRYEELKDKTDRVVTLETDKRYLVTKAGEVYLLADQN